MKRLIYDRLVGWKLSIPHKPLILLGARQVGKTYILKEFGENEFPRMVYLNCHEDERAQWLFRNLDTDRILRELESISECTIKEGETFVFFDEIQEVNNGIASLKYFCENHPTLHVAVAGSLLGISLRENESYPVGKVQTMRLYPMSFNEYLEALGKHKLLECLRELSWETLTMHHEVLTTLLREYMFVGGMPEAVAEYTSTHNATHVREIQAEISDAYIRDVSKHTKPTIQRIHQVWESIPAQLARENKKFIFGAVRRGARAADFETALQWLTDAGLIYKIERCKKPIPPIKFYSDSSAFKIYMFDCGLLAYMCGASPKEMLGGNSAFVEFKGALTENYVLQQLQSVCDSNGVFYFAKDNSTQEIDFLTQFGNQVIPIEVKAEVNVKSKSLSGFVNVDHANQHLKGLRFSMQPYTDQGWMENIPLYAAEAYFNRCNQ